LFTDILKLKTVNGVVLDKLEKAYEKEEEMVEDADSAGGKSKEMSIMNV